ncbi:MAG: bifunctional (p)ppGpp synthetase/guanosine-3',5'-bis(diphosphate) 3'-pyrophosphohydrolase [Bacillota bacterium]|jgi:GTP pyrophosphokinase|nr:bifunctional (p)ppGpp synthetase/guanosine-3',5'-bis(diphosphate) 3'-pyrophosphohydrolase [Eubacteriales bacterium]MDD3537819.1 bifunctional (p)ppGpp synthetase/guanosine-3',5'-bis(diphosphate) 3'-pyrophosphohydrolase [Eubacteriales bacterium]MDD4285712.1 bifunctional (p)ppGpp synthetase/guanosine-3',5'-bis(diphosphate) 3'-pyrophosphohydrolase [Eubacteriales bacterium]MDI9492411.1 bifunctional (p)ppGpp synthetase/guanosine-3',5'-bis(diphosphate) 3'-pyrophosphohydrolase [Bacillota bacterium]
MTDFISNLLALNPNYDTAFLERAYQKAEQLHRQQFRRSGEPYITHPEAVANILGELGMDDHTLAAGLLHDAVEDTDYKLADLEKEFGSQVALLVDGVTKLGSLVYESREDRQAENIRKMFLAMSKDIRVLIIKLADRLHNLRTINYMNEEQIREKCIETLEIYAPLASRLGIYAFKFEMEDIAFKNLEPEAYEKLETAVSLRQEERGKAINRVIGEIKEMLDELQIRYEITGRSKHYYSIYKKMQFQQKQLDEIFDLTAIRIIVESIKDCYGVLGAVHTKWKPIPGRFKDYVAMPKPNRYQSLHTTVIGETGNPFEIQIRTAEMHRIAEYGIAAHWKYKEGIQSEDEEVKLAWIRQTLEWQQDVNDPKEFMETLKLDLFSNQVFVFTPKGDVMELPAGSTPLDFAFKIHTAVGAKCVGAKVNGKMVPIDYVLQNGEIIDIVTSSNSRGPSIDWLKIAKTNSARNKIRQWLKKENKSANSDKGKEMLEKAAKRKGYDLQLVLKNQYVGRAAKAMNYSSVDDLYTAISYGGPLMNRTLLMCAGYYHEEKQADLKRKEKQEEKIKAAEPKKREHTKGITVKGVGNLLIRFAKCCSPVPGDDIIGYTTKGRGVSIHRKDCINILSMPEHEQARLIEVEWDTSEENISYDAEISLLAEDRKGLFADVSKACEEMDINITSVNAKTDKDGITNMTLTLSISNTAHIIKILNRFSQIRSVVDVYRTNS